MSGRGGGDTLVGGHGDDPIDGGDGEDSADGVASFRRVAAATEAAPILQ